MANSRYSDAITIREIEYAIQIRDKDKNYNELHELLLAELTRFEYTRKKGDKLENPVRDFLQTNIERSIVIRDNTRVYFLDYHEHGSLTIQFKLLVITRYVNYGSTRQALDFLIKDTIGEYFEELLERHVPVSVAVHATDHELYEIPSVPHIDSTKKVRLNPDYFPVIISSISLLIAVCIGLVLIFRGSSLPESKKPSEEYRDKYYELLIEKQVMQAFENEKYNELVRKKAETAADSVYHLTPGQKY